MPNTPNDKAQANMREQNSTNLNTSGKEGVKVAPRQQQQSVTKSHGIHRDPNRR